VENGFIVFTLEHVTQKIITAYRRPKAIQFHHDITHGGFQPDTRKRILRDHIRGKTFRGGCPQAEIEQAQKHEQTDLSQRVAH
jgi:hypothetical protein